MNAVAQRGGKQRIHSVYLDDRENEAVRAISMANGQSPNAVIRIAVRALLGLPTVSITITDELRERFDLT